MDDIFLPIVIVGMLFIGLPWLVFHYVTKWKGQATLTTEDENLLDELHDIARRLDERLCTVERIMTAENPNWRSLACDPATLGIPSDTRAAPRAGFDAGGSTEPRAVSNRPVRSIDQ